MTTKLFYQLTEIYTTPLGLIWLILATSYSYYYYGTFNWGFAVVALILVFMFHLITNMQNNYMDYLHASDGGTYKTKTSTIGKNQINLKSVKTWMYSLAIVPILGGLALGYLTGPVTFGIGILAVIIGLAYSAGPKPLNSTFLCEFAVSFPIAICIPMTYVYLGSINSWQFDGVSMLRSAAISLVPFLIFYMLQLANNTCDLDEDVQNGRKTLVYYLQKLAVFKVFTVLFWTAGLVIFPLVLFKLAPWTILLTWVIFPKVCKKSKIFFSNQDKATVYGILVKNNSQIVMLYVLLFAIGTMIERIF